MQQNGKKFYEILRFTNIKKNNTVQEVTLIKPLKLEFFIPHNAHNDNEKP